MFKFNEFVNASSIWPTAEDFTDFGAKPGLVRGYNVEVKTLDGKVDWLSCNFFYEEPEAYYNNDFNTWRFEEHGWTPTGRICFRGYYKEEYSWEERETFVVPVKVEK